MKNILVFLLLSLLLLSGLAMAQSHQFLNDRSVLNFNDNWGLAHAETLHVKTAETDTVVLSGTMPGYNLLVQSLAGDVLLKLRSSWSVWWTIHDSSAFSLSGGRVDTLFVTTGETDSSVVQILWTSWE